MIRRETELWEEEHLSPFAARSSLSRGRQREEKECDVRTAFQRDRDRILHSKAFRRLKHKTQVFIAPEGDHYRTRLTHTLEVAQIARTIARALRLNEDLTEAIALGHDLGHTAFGHAGEEALQEVYLPGFAHNEQSLRIVDKIEGGGAGLNLTWEVRDGILHHTGDQDPATLEGQIVKIADRIAYINHDIDDAIRGGVLELEDLPRDLLTVLGRKHSERINIMVRDMIEASRQQPRIRMSPEIWEATMALRSFLFERVYVGSQAKAEEEKAKNIVQELYSYYVEHPEQVPAEFLTIARQEGESQGRSEEENRARAVVDYVAGMTDRYAIKKYTDLFVPRGFPLFQ
ncbi:MAG: deoxyguanosinetriphosphate triphosphohydrolase [Bacillota bacterium]